MSSSPDPSRSTQPQAEEAPSDEESAAASSEGEGVDLRPGRGSPSDSSEEEDDDSEAEREVRKGFIVDEDDATERRRRKKKRRKDRSSGVDGEGKKRRREHNSDDEGDLDEDDLALLAENTGIDLGKPKKNKLRRLRRRRSVSADSGGSPSNQRDLVNIFNDDEGDAAGVENLFDADEMAGFIEDDTDESGRGSDEDSDEGERRRRRKEKQKKRDSRKQGGRKGFGMGSVEGITAEAWQEVAEVFGTGQDYAWAMEEDEEDSTKKEKNLKDIFEPSEIASRMLTKEDDKIRNDDIPERLQLACGANPPVANEETGEFDPLIPEEEVRPAALWMSQKMPREAIERFLLKDDLGNLPPLYDAFIGAIEAVVRFINIDFFEPPFIWTHRSDHLVHFPAGESRPHFLLFEQDLWKISALSARYRAFLARRTALQDQFRQLDVDDEYFDELMQQLETVEEIQDAQEWVKTKYGDKLEEVKRNREDDDERAVAKIGTTKRANRQSDYEGLKKGMIGKLAESFGLSSTDLALDVASGTTTHFAEDPVDTPQEAADKYVNGAEFATWERVLDAAKSVVVHEIGRDPILRQFIRRHFKSSARVTVEATKDGQTKIDPMNIFYAFKYLRAKPVAEFARSPQWLQMLAAEAEGLVKVSVTLPQNVRDLVIAELEKFYLSDFTSDLADEWNELRTDILKQALKEHFLPMGEQWIRTSLKEDAEELIMMAIKRRLESRIDNAPWRRDDGTMEPGQTPSVLAISQGNGDPRRDSVYAVFLDSDGHFREHLKLDTLETGSMEASQHEAFTELLKRRRPQVVVVGGFSPSTRRLMNDFRTLASAVSSSILESEMDLDDDEEERKLPTEERQRKRAARAAFESTYVNDEVARIYQNSARATTEFSEFSPVAKYCVGLARYAQSPLNEYAALGPDLTAITYDPNQKFLAKEKVLEALERGLVEVTNKVGVDVNKAARNVYYANLLPYVAGLGHRKAEMFVKRIAAAGGTIITRFSVLPQALLTPKVFVNAASFLRIRQDDLAADLGRDTEGEADPDVLDDTRIHPEDYDVARKMAADAMELDEEDLVDMPASKAVADLFDDDVNKLNELALDDFADELSKVLQAPKRLALYKIRDEMKQPFREMRRQFTSPDPRELFTMLTGETELTLDQGLIIPVRVVRVSGDESVLVRLDCGIDGVVSHEYRSTAAAFAKLRQGQTLQAQVLDVRWDDFTVELSTQEDQLAQGDRERRMVRADPYFDHDKANYERQSIEKAQQKKTGRPQRIIKHPNFHNVDSGKAEEMLSSMQRGDCVIRPSSREHHLAVTWKVDEGLYQHLAVHELNKPDEFSLGTQLRVDDNHRYSDLDEMIEAHIKNMARKVNELTNNDKWKSNKEQLDKYLQIFTQSNPGRAAYGFAWSSDKRRAGEIILGFRANEKAEIQQFPVKLVPEGYSLFTCVHPTVQLLANAFKIWYSQNMTNAAQRAQGGMPGKTPAYPGAIGGRTPFGGASSQYRGNPSGRTPGYAGPVGGRTPLLAGAMSGLPGGRTPQPDHGGYGYGQGGGGGGGPRGGY
ncbi:chromatin-remodeling histone chaperone SPT6 [Sporobolomyces koalae]|uniref:chromatin-remodeling histone chaperone SPT6 n=1 Tax=Sporobolomyces koalae TaxID=500713 RepID=UPI00317A1412